MGCDTKGFVLTKEKDVFKICKIIETAIFNEIKNDSGIDNITAVWGENYSYPKFEISTIGMITCHFTFADEDRQMSIHTLCDNDYNEARKGKKIILSLGAWGKSVRLIKVVLSALSELGKAYIIENDCSDEWRKFGGDTNKV